MWHQTLNIIISSILVLFSIASALSQAGGALSVRVDITVCFDECKQCEHDDDLADKNGGPPPELSVQSPQLIFAWKTENVASCAALIS